MKYFDIMNLAASSLGLEFDENKYEKFIKYKDLIKEWNEKVNLTAIIEDEEIIKKHFIDSIKGLEYEGFKNAEKIIDIGTGAGFPGLPIKIMCPEKKVTLLDSLNKRIIFLQQVIKDLDLNEVETIHGRAEDFARKPEYREQYDVATSRAVANLATLSELCLPYVKVGGYLIALKGPSVDEEIAMSKNAIGYLGGKLQKIIEIQIEESNLKHNLVIIKKIKKTSKTYPRKAGTPAKNPIK